MSAKTQAFKCALINALGGSGLPRLFAKSTGGVGAIIAMHRVREPEKESFQPNRTLEVAPQFLDQTLSQIRDLGFDFVSLDEVSRRLRERDSKRRFVCFTLDDGYADNYENAAPIFKAHDVPFSIHTTTGFLDGTAYFWWMLLEEVIRDRDEVTLRITDETERRSTRTLEEKGRAFLAWHERFRALSTKDVENASRHLCEDHGIDLRAFNARHAMTWEMAREITEGGIGTIEAHTERHFALSLQQPADIRAETAGVLARIEEMTGRAPRHFAYPFGDEKAVSQSAIDLIRDLGMATATTTRPGNLRPQHANHLTDLPRITLNGLYQTKRFVDLALSGLPYVFSRA